MADIKTPLGPIPRPMAYLALAAGAGAIIYVYVKKKNAKSKASTSANPVAAAYGYGSNPYAYGYSPYGYGAYTYQPYGYGYGPYGLGSYPGASGFGYGYYGAGVPVQVPTQASTNAQWSQAAVSALTAQGYSGQDVLGALGLYITGGQVSQAQQGIIQAAIAAEGYPPIPGSNGMPPAINTGASGGGGTGQTSNLTVPNVKGLTVAQAHTILQSEGFNVPGGINGTWIVTGTQPPAGASVAKNGVVKILASAAKKSSGGGGEKED